MYLEYWTLSLRLLLMVYPKVLFPLHFSITAAIDILHLSLKAAGDIRWLA